MSHHHYQLCRIAAILTTLGLHNLYYRAAALRHTHNANPNPHMYLPRYRVLNDNAAPQHPSPYHNIWWVSHTAPRAHTSRATIQRAISCARTRAILRVRAYAISSMRAWGVWPRSPNARIPFRVHGSRAKKFCHIPTHHTTRPLAMLGETVVECCKCGTRVARGVKVVTNTKG